MDYKIIIPVTFREFDDGVDAKIQLAWLDELKKQTYTNFELIVTSFREKKVKQVIEDSGVNHTFYQSERDCLFSMTEMFINCKSHIEKGKTIIFHCTADHILDYDFFEVLNKKFEKGTGGTSFPHMQHPNIESYKSGNLWDEYYHKPVNSIFEYDPNMHLPECFYLDGDLLIERGIFDKWDKYTLDGVFPGIGLSLYFMAWNKKLKNLVFFTKIHKIGNDLEIHQVSKNSSPDMDKNNPILLSYCKHMGHSKSITHGSQWLSRKFAMHMRYIPYGNFWQKLQFKKYLLYFLIFPRKQFVIFKVLKRVLSLSNKRMTDMR